MLKHFLPPVAVNALLGTVLWTSYGHVYSYLEPSCGNHTALAAAISGGVAGGCQALVAAPAENVRLFLEGGSGGISWSHAWKEVFRNQIISQNHQREEIRQVRSWMRDVGEMAGRGWNGWRWGCCKDICGKHLCARPFIDSCQSSHGKVLRRSSQSLRLLDKQVRWSERPHSQTHC